jgi:hypothetical protein
MKPILILYLPRVKLKAPIAPLAPKAIKINSTAAEYTPDYLIPSN